MTCRIRSAIGSALLLFTSVSAQSFSRIIEDVPLVPDSSQQIADRIVQSKIPVVVDFWAAWCAPCRILNPVLEKLEKKYRGRVLFMKVNVDYHRQIAAYFRIQGIPAVFIIRDKEVQQVLGGVQPEADYRKAIDEVLAMAPVKGDTVKRKDPVKKEERAGAVKNKSADTRTDETGTEKNE